MNDEIEYEEVDVVPNGSTWSIRYFLMTFVDVYGLAIVEKFVSIIYAIYLRLTFFNVVIFCLKYVPTGICMYKFVKHAIVTSQDRLKQKQMELEDIQLQIQIMSTKLCACDAEFNERSQLLPRDLERLCRVRARVRDVIAANDTLRRELDSAADCDLDIDVHDFPLEDTDFVNELFKSMKKYDHYANPDRNVEMMRHGEQPDTEPALDQNSSYSSLSDTDVRQDCSVKIIKITNSHKVAYLKHYIRKKKLRRANKRAALKMKMESVKKLLEYWQKTLNMVINSKLTILNIVTHPIDVASQEAMGDYSKPRDSSDSDSDMRNDMFYDEYSVSWAQNPRPHLYNYEDIQDTAVSRDFYESYENGDSTYSPSMQCEYGGPKPPKMMAILEETGSQIAIEEVTNEDEYRNLDAEDD